MSEDLINLFRNFKLGNSLFRHKVTFTPTELENYRKSDINCDEIIISEQRQKVAEHIVNHHRTATKKTINENGDTVYSLELLILQMEDFKTIVEAAIALIPDDKIQEIKKGKQI